MDQLSDEFIKINLEAQWEVEKVLGHTEMDSKTVLIIKWKDIVVNGREKQIIEQWDTCQEDLKEIVKVPGTQDDYLVKWNDESLEWAELLEDCPKVQPYIAKLKTQELNKSRGKKR